MNRVFSKEFVQGWKKALIDTYGFEEYMDFVVQPSFGKKYLSYLPFINYTDRTSDEIEDLLELAKDNHFQIRTLNFDYQDFKDHDTITMRLDISDINDEETLMMKKYKKRQRTRIRKLKKENNIVIKRTKNVDTIYEIIKAIHNSHGTPMFPKQLYINFYKYLYENLYVYLIYHKGDLAGGTITFQDHKILYLHSGGIPDIMKSKVSTHLLDHFIILDALNNSDISIVDFGRSAYNGGTYLYKIQFGAKPVKIDIHTNTPKDIYSAYSWASNIWKKLPDAITDTIGPKLTKYLVDL